MDGVVRSRRHQRLDHAIKARIDMLTTGVRTPVGIKVYGGDLAEIQRIGERLERVMKDIPGTRSVFAERVTGGYFVDIEPKRDQLARYGLTIEKLQDVVYERRRRREHHHDDRGRERYPVNLRYPRELRRISTGSGGCSFHGDGDAVPIAQLADVKLVQGRRCSATRTVSCGTSTSTSPARRGGYVEEAKKVVASQVSLKQGTSSSGAASTRT